MSCFINPNTRVYQFSIRNRGRNGDCLYTFRQTFTTKLCDRATHGLIEKKLFFYFAPIGVKRVFSGVVFLPNHGGHFSSNPVLISSLNAESMYAQTGRERLAIVQRMAVFESNVYIGHDQLKQNRLA